VSPIFVGVETSEEKAKPVIFFYDPLGAHFEAAAYAGSGSGSGTIKSILHYLETWGHPRPADLPLNKAVALANRLLMTAAEFDTATGGVHPEQHEFATIKLLSRDGTRSIARDEQEKYWKEAERQ
jgi:proteasome beta subunit